MTMALANWASLLVYLATFVAGVDPDASVDTLATRGSLHMARNPTTIATSKTAKQSPRNHFQVLQGGAFMALKAKVKRFDTSERYGDNDDNVDPGNATEVTRNASGTDQDASKNGISVTPTELSSIAHPGRSKKGTSSKANAAADNSEDGDLISEKWLKELFLMLVADGSGSIRRDEWFAMMASSGWSETMWQKFDENKNQKISFEEFIRHWEAAVTAAYDSMGKNTEKWDASKQEMKLAKELLGDNDELDRDKFEEFIYSAVMYRALDSDNDGHVTWAECNLETKMAKNICKIAQDRQTKDRDMATIELWRVLCDPMHVFAHKSAKSETSEEEEEEEPVTEKVKSKVEELEEAVEEAVFPKEEGRKGGSSWGYFVFFVLLIIVLGAVGYFAYSAMNADDSPKRPSGFDAEQYPGAEDQYAMTGDQYGGANDQYAMTGGQYAGASDQYPPNQYPPGPMVQ